MSHTWGTCRATCMAFIEPSVGYTQYTLFGLEMWPYGSCSYDPICAPCMALCLPYKGTIYGSIRVLNMALCAPCIKAQTRSRCIGSRNVWLLSRRTLAAGVAYFGAAVL